MRDLSYPLGDPLDDVLATFSPVLSVLVIAVLAVLFIILFIKGGTAMGDHLERRNVFAISISRRPKVGQSYKHPPRSRPSTAQVLLVFGFSALALITLVVWVLYRLSESLPVP